MNRTIFMICAIFALSISCKKEDPKIDNLKVFTKAYGYVKYFHPSDEASKIDWSTFAAYGTNEIVKCKNEAEVVATLNKLFNPIAPSVVFSNKESDYNLSIITPKDTTGYKPTYWQHKGVSKDMIYDYLYKSVRIGRDTEKDESSTFGNLTSSINLEKYRGKKIKYTGWVKLKKGSKGTGHLWTRIDKENNTTGFFYNMDDKPIKSTTWKQYEIIIDVDDTASKLLFGSFIKGKGTLYIDDVHLSYQENEKWIEVPIKNNNFEEKEIGKRDEKSDWSGKSKGYTYEVSTTENKEGKNCAVIAYKGIIKKIKGESIFDAHPKFGELIEKKIGENIYCQIPLNLYFNEDGTYPKSKDLTALQNTLDTINVDNNLSMRLGNIVNTYNVFQHFYPYFKEVNVNWEKELETALNRSFKDVTKNDHAITLQKFTAPLKDGHIWISGGDFGKYAPPVNWQWMEDKLVITDVFNDSIDVKVGDIVTKINNIPTKEYFDEINSRISAGTKGWKNYRAQGNSMFGKKDTEIIIEINNKPITLKRDGMHTFGVTLNKIQEENTHKQLDNNIYYLNIDGIKMDTITKLLPKLQEAGGIICDLRGYPNSNHGFISHLLKENDTINNWMRIPKFIYPDQEKIVGYDDEGWLLEAKKPYLGDKKIVFMIDGNSISYAESYMGFIDGYNLATIIGQPTAGANGNINPFNLLGDYRVSWTGMKVLKHDGSQHHAVGVLPDIYVVKTIEGVKAGKDEFLEKAIEVILE